MRACPNRSPSASSCDAVIAFPGLGKTIEREGREKPDLDPLPDQRALIRAEFQANLRTVVVLVNVSPLSIRDLAIYDEQRRAFVVESGEFGIQVGASSEDIRLVGSLRIAGEGR